MIAGKRVAVVGSREFKTYAQIEIFLDSILKPDDELVSGGAMGADSMAQRYAKEHGFPIYIFYPRWEHGKSAGFQRNKRIVEHADLVAAFYAKGRFQQGGTLNTAQWSNKLGIKLIEIEEV